MSKVESKKKLNIEMGINSYEINKINLKNLILNQSIINKTNKINLLENDIKKSKPKQKKP